MKKLEDKNKETKVERYECESCRDYGIKMKGRNLIICPECEGKRKPNPKK